MTRTPTDEDYKWATQDFDPHPENNRGCGEYFPCKYHGKKDEEIAKLRADNENMAKLNDSFPEEIARLEDEIAVLKEEIEKTQVGCDGRHAHNGPPDGHAHGNGTEWLECNPRILHHHHDNKCLLAYKQEIAALKEKIKEQDEAIYCPTCGACGEEGCCPPDRCEHIKCFYGEHYAKTYRELEAENEALRTLVERLRHK